jgi:hypothetical protein
MKKKKERELQFIYIDVRCPFITSNPLAHEGSSYIYNIDHVCVQRIIQLGMK